MATPAAPDATPLVLEPLTKRKAWKALQNTLRDGARLTPTKTFCG